MTRQAYYPVRVADQILWLENLRIKFAGHAPTLGISTAKCDAGIADARWLVDTLGSWLPAVRDWQKACTAAAEQAQSGSGAAALVLPLFTPPALPADSRWSRAVLARQAGRPGGLREELEQRHADARGDRRRPRARAC